MTTLTAPSAVPGSARYTLLLLAAVFILPFIIACGLFWSGWRPGQFVNHGELLQPPRQLPETGLHRADGRPLAMSELRGKWLLVVPVAGNCGTACQQLLHGLLQVHLALNKEQNRLQRVLISTAASAPADETALTEVQRQFPGLVIAAVDGEAAGAAWLRPLESSGPAIFVVDPLGKVIMRYADPNDLRGVLRDLERLLKYSWIR
jgi:hypothetical protein